MKHKAWAGLGLGRTSSVLNVLGSQEKNTESSSVCLLPKTAPTPVGPTFETDSSDGPWDRAIHQPMPPASTAAAHFCIQTVEGLPHKALSRCPSPPKFYGILSSRKKQSSPSPPRWCHISFFSLVLPKLGPCIFRPSGLSSGTQHTHTTYTPHIRVLRSRLLL